VRAIAPALEQGQQQLLRSSIATFRLQVPEDWLAD